jgi:hypothetical protein
MKYIIEGFSTCTISPTSINALIQIGSTEYCLSPDSSVPGSVSNPIARAGDKVSIQYSGAFNSPIVIHYDNSDYTITPAPDGSWPRRDNTNFVVPPGRLIQSIEVLENTPVKSGIYNWLRGLVNTGISGSGFFSGTAADSHVTENPNWFETRDVVDYTQPQAQTQYRPVYNQLIGTNQDCSTYNDCSC